MLDTLPSFLRSRAARSLRYIIEQTRDLTTAQALRYAVPAWPDQPWGIGQNGSIAGIVYHVAAWKQLTLPLFDSEGVAGGRADFNPDNAPAPTDWPGVAAWLEQVGAQWNARLNSLPDAEFDAERTWAGVTISLTKYVAEMLEHDIQHAAQIEYLRQRMRTESGLT